MERTVKCGAACGGHRRRRRRRVGSAREIYFVSDTIMCVCCDGRQLGALAALQSPIFCVLHDDGDDVGWTENTSSSSNLRHGDAVCALACAK